MLLEPGSGRYHSLFLSFLLKKQMVIKMSHDDDTRLR
jgi:hypothetical protein